MIDSMSASKQSAHDVPGDEIRQALERAIRDRGLRRFAILDSVGEGLFYPNGMEQRSGDVMDQDGRIWMFWTAWDPIRKLVTIRDWEEAAVIPALMATRGYVRARQQLGLEEHR